MPFHTFKFALATPDEFVRFWSQAYDDPYEPLYNHNIHGNRHGQVGQERIWNLFRWKNGGNLSQRKRQTVQEHFIGRLQELDQFPVHVQAENFDKLARARAFLDLFTGGGPIWRIFFLHIHHPDRFPIFDQHVYRAMKFIQERPGELPTDEDMIEQTYINEYLGFHNCAFGQHAGRAVDKALWAFGKFLKRYPNLLRLL